MGPKGEKLKGPLIHRTIGITVATPTSFVLLGETLSVMESIRGASLIGSRGASCSRSAFERR